MMEYRRFQNRIAIRLDPGDEIVEMVTKVAEAEHISAATVQGVGFTDEMRLRIYDRAKDKFNYPVVNGDMEITSLTGNIVMTENGLFAHLHIMAAGEDATVRGGHLIKCAIAATGEIVPDAIEGAVRRGPSDDEKLGTLIF